MCRRARRASRGWGAGAHPDDRRDLLPVRAGRPDRARLQRRPPRRRDVARRRPSWWPPRVRSAARVRDRIHDPCYLDPTASAPPAPVVDCAASPWAPRIVRLHVTAPPVPALAAPPDLAPWALQLASGRRCVRTTGATTTVRGRRLTLTSATGTACSSGGRRPRRRPGASVRPVTPAATPPATSPSPSPGAERSPSTSHRPARVV